MRHDTKTVMPALIRHRYLAGFSFNWDYFNSTHARNSYTSPFLTLPSPSSLNLSSTTSLVHSHPCISSRTPLLPPPLCLALASVQSELFTPGLLVLINEADILLSTGQFWAAAKVHLEAITQSCANYLLYYEGGTVYFSMQRHTSTLKNFKRVLSLISSDFNNVHLIET
ncbi:hypothetical protein BJ165DRAFT_330204 [Panaeolus papilionaceus]|nr:hypothetical protein BJ165DRAFT_330204 [Panaeolus papilionaceus]